MSTINLKKAEAVGQNLWLRAIEGTNYEGSVFPLIENRRHYKRMLASIFYNQERVLQSGESEV